MKLFDNQARKYGTYIERAIHQFSPEIEAEWDKWLDNNPDMGHWDAWKDRHTGKYRVDTFMPPHLVCKLNEAD